MYQLVAARPDTLRKVVPVLVSCGVTRPTATSCCSCLPLPFPSPPPLWCLVPPTFRRAACTPLPNCEVNTACTGAADGQRTCGNCANGFWEDDANNACTGRREGACEASSMPPRPKPPSVFTNFPPARSRIHLPHSSRSHSLMRPRAQPACRPADLPV